MLGKGVCCGTVGVPDYLIQKVFVANALHGAVGWEQQLGRDWCEVLDTPDLLVWLEGSREALA